MSCDRLSQFIGGSVSELELELELKLQVAITSLISRCLST